MVLKFAHWLSAALIIALVAISAPVLAHKDHDKKQAPTESTAGQMGPVAAPASGDQAPASSHATMGETMGHDGANPSFANGLMDWLGRLHPILVHFPIAFFPAALFTAVIGRRRPSFGAPVQFLVVAGGIIAPIAAVLGWLDAPGMDPDPLLTVHRWLGTAIGAFALLLALWAWRRPEQDRSGAMLAGLAVITAAIVIQGWYGGALVHGIDHMNW